MGSELPCKCADAGVEEGGSGVGPPLSIFNAGKAGRAVAQQEGISRVLWPAAEMLLEDSNKTGTLLELSQQLQLHVITYVLIALLNAEPEATEGSVDSIVHSHR